VLRLLLLPPAVAAGWPNLRAERSCGHPIAHVILGLSGSDLLGLSVDTWNCQQTKHQHEEGLQAFYCLFAIFDAM
jgi:hypothetical protein